MGRVQRIFKRGVRLCNLGARIIVRRMNATRWCGRYWIWRKKILQKQWVGVAAVSPKTEWPYRLRFGENLTARADECAVARYTLTCIVTYSPKLSFLENGVRAQTVFDGSRKSPKAFCFSIWRICRTTGNLVLRCSTVLCFE